MANPINGTSIGECLSPTNNKIMLAHYFNQAVDQRLNKIDPTGTAVLLSMAINGLYQEKLSAFEIAQIILKYTNGENRITLLQIRDALLELHFKAIGYKNALSEFKQCKNAHSMMAMTIDDMHNIILLLSLEDDFAYFMYPEGVICKIDINTFIQNNPPILLIENKIDTPLLPSPQP